MLRQFFSGYLLTLACAVIVVVGLFAIFTLVSYLTGPVGG